MEIIPFVVYGQLILTRPFNGAIIISSTNDAETTVQADAIE